MNEFSDGTEKTIIKPGDIKISKVTLPVDWPESHYGTGIVLVQPKVELVHSGFGGFKIKPIHQKTYIKILRYALDLARKQLNPSLPNSFFIALPEYSLPSELFNECELAIKELLPPNSVCFFGFDAMKPEQWDSLQKRAANRLNENIQTFEWVNTAIVWVKDKSGKLDYYLQAKLKPNPEEHEASQMYQGNEILYFDVGKRSFAILICYDYIAKLDNPSMSVPKIMVESFNERVKAGVLSRLGYLFVLECNPKHNHESFQLSSQAFLKDSYGPETVVFVNAAFESGCSGLCYDRSLWEPTKRETKLTDIPIIYRRIEMQFELTGFLFREGAPAIHSLVHKFKSDLPRDPGVQRSPIERQQLVCIDGHDFKLQEYPSVLKHEVKEATKKASPENFEPKPLANCSLLLDTIQKSYKSIIDMIIQLDLSRVEDIIYILFGKKGIPNPDYWTQEEKESMIALVQTLYLLKTCGFQVLLDNIEFNDITVSCNYFTVSILAGGKRKRLESITENFLESFYGVIQPHIFYLIEHYEISPKTGIELIDYKKLRKEGAGLAQVSIPFNNDEFGWKEGEEPINSSRVYWSDLKSLTHLVSNSRDLEAFINRVKEVFQCLAA
jgi:hypothetical protein